MRGGYIDVERLSEEDQDLLFEADQVHYTDWPKVAGMEDEAESEEAKKYLHDLAVSLYRQEEASCGCL
jgi:hypothetical protein